MRLIVIHRAKDVEKSRTLTFFAASCKKLNVEFFPININDFDYFNLPTLSENDILYRIASGERSRVFERLIINDVCRHFYTNWRHALSTRSTSYYLHKKRDLPVIPTIPLMPKDRMEVEKFAERLGGFPIIVKALGGSKGVGVMRVDSQESLVSICDFLRDEDTSVILRKYVEHKYYGRLIVLGNRVVASNRTESLAGDFRTNTSDTPNGKAFVFAAGVEKMAVEAVAQLGLEFGGVDIIFDLEGKAHIAEVNFPTDFACCQDITGIDIASMMLEHAMKD